MCCAEAHRLCTLNTIHQRNTGHSLARPTLDADTELHYCNNIHRLPHHVAIFSIRKTPFHASLVKSRALHTTCVFNPVLLYVHGGVCCLLTAKKLVWFPWQAGSWNPRRWVLNGDLVSKGSSSSSALQDGTPTGGLLSRASNVYIWSWDSSSTGPAKEEPPALPPRGRISATAPQLLGTQLLTRTW